MHKCYVTSRNQFRFFKTVYYNITNVVEIQKQTNNELSINMKKFI